MQTALSQRQLKRIRRKNRGKWSRQRLRLLKRRQSAQLISLSRRLCKQKQRLGQLTQQILMLLERKRGNQKRANKAKTLRRLQQRRRPAAVSCHFDEC
jgi:hypothetical protein